MNTVTLTKTRKYVTIEDLSPGDTFSFGGHLYMRMSTLYLSLPHNGNYGANCISLLTGLTTWFSTEKLEPVTEVTISCDKRE